MFTLLLVVAAPTAIVSVTAYYVTLAWIQHRERMAGLMSDEIDEPRRAPIGDAARRT